MNSQPVPEQESPATSEALAEALAEVVDRVAKDARRAPEAYLQETLVPEGGE